MIINSVELHNIRSYRQAKIDFTDGVTLLAGDIGSGKSTILLAIEFALFGIRRGDIQGDGLLRHGEKQGFVTLTFTTDQTYTIQRTLKRSSQGVRQDAGFLATNNIHEDLSANELKARIIQILNYPEDLITKQKGFVFRYTVYTPQEDMKQILYEDDSTRLDTLRSVFGVDKYKTITENASILAKSMRDDKRFLRTQLDAFTELDLELQEKQDQHSTLQTQLKTLQESITTKTDTLNKTKAEGEKLQTLYQQEQQRQQELTRITTKQQAITKRLQEISQKRTLLQHRLAKTQQPIEDPSSQLQDLQDKRQTCIEKRAQAQAKANQLQEEIAQLEKSKTDITSLTECPVCKQDVTTDHKAHIQADVNKKQAQLQERLKKVQDVQNKAQAILTQLDQKQESLRARNTLYQGYREFLIQQKQATQQLEELDTEEQTLQEEYKSLIPPKPTTFNQETYNAFTSKLEAAQDALKDDELARSSLTAKLEAITERINQLKLQQEKKTQIESQLTATTEKERWLSKAFLPTAEIIEKHVLATVHNEFNRLFTNWFLTLIEDDAMYAELSSNFTPTVTQNGYDADISHLSGGEKTSVALAYRLALATVVNTLFRQIKTTDLLILDEPTDGFSTEQLDRVRTVLNQLEVQQVIIVSHEQKMESYVDNVIRVTKQHGVSQV